MKVLTVALFLLSGCAGSFELGRTRGELKREEVIAAFSQRDALLVALEKRLKAIEERKS